MKIKWWSCIILFRLYKSFIIKSVDMFKEKVRIIVHKLIEYHTLDNICKEYQLNDTDKKRIKSIMDKKWI